jgi:hypothetical protein
MRACSSPTEVLKASFLGKITGSLGIFSSHLCPCLQKARSCATGVDFPYSQAGVPKASHGRCHHCNCGRCHGLHVVAVVVSTSLQSRSQLSCHRRHSCGLGILIGVCHWCWCRIVIIIVVVHHLNCSRMSFSLLNLWKLRGTDHNCPDQQALLASNSLL